MVSMVKLETLACNEYELTQTQFEQIQETVSMFRGLKRKELAFALCDTLQWSSFQKRNKNRICLDLLAKLEELGVV